MPETILIVAHGHPEPSPGGAEIAAYQLFRSLRETPGVTAWFVAADDPLQPQLRVPLAPFAGRGDEFLLNAGDVDPFLYSQRAGEVVEAFAALVARLDPDVVHFHHYSGLGLELFAAVRRAAPRARIVLTLHEYRAICGNYGQMVKTGSGALCRAAAPADCALCFPDRAPGDFVRRREFIRLHFALVDRFAAPSAFLRRRYIEWGVPEARISVVENGTPAASAPPRAATPGKRRPVFGFFGQVNPYKGLVELLTAFTALVGEPAQRDLRLNIHAAYLDLNPPDYVAAVRGLLAQTAPQVQFFGPYRREELGALIGAVDWVVVPSLWWENAPLVIEEALSYRRPVLCSDIGGMAEKVRPGLDGFHFPVGDAAALAALIRRVAADPGLWDGLQGTMRTPVTVAQAAADYLRLYRDRADPAPSPPIPAVPETAPIPPGTARIVSLGPGLYRLAVASLSPAVSDGIVHIAAFSGEDARALDIFGADGDIGDTWLDAAGGIAIVQSRAATARLVVTAYSRSGAVIDPPEIVVSPISGGRGDG